MIDGNKKVYVYDASMTLLGSWSPGSLKTPTGAITAGKYDMELLCANAGGAKEALRIANAAAQEQGRTYDRSRLRVVGSFHIAENIPSSVKLGVRPIKSRIR